MDGLEPRTGGAPGRRRTLRGEYFGTNERGRDPGAGRWGGSARRVAGCWVRTGPALVGKPCSGRFDVRTCGAPGCRWRGSRDWWRRGPRRGRRWRSTPLGCTGRRWMRMCLWLACWKGSAEAQRYVSIIARSKMSWRFSRLGKISCTPCANATVTADSVPGCGDSAIQLLRKPVSYMVADNFCVFR